MKTIHVDLGDRSYPIFISSDLIASKTAQTLLADSIRGKQVMIVTNETIAPIYLKKVEQLLAHEYQVSSTILPDGESFKNLDTLNQIFTSLLESRHNRTTTLIALGGGVIGDMTGYAAASYQRGVDFIQIPTTLLAQVDSSVGGKTGVNHALGKNMIGAFKQPQSVIIDIDTLQTLDKRQFAAGMAEVIKYGLIWDSEFFKWIEDNIVQLVSRDPDTLQYAIAKSCEIKAAVVAEDETEKGLRAILNLGHTFGHAMETFGNYSTFLHGEAVAAGMVMATDLSERLGWLETGITDRLKKLNQQLNLPNSSPEGMDMDDYINYMSVDKKNLDSDIRLVLLMGLGKAIITTEYDKVVFESTLKDYCS